MEDKFKQRKITALKIQTARLRLGGEFERKTITTDDLAWLLRQNSDFGLVEVSSSKEKVLQEIFNAPFLLCDQVALDLEIKKLLPSILGVRYHQEVEELKYLRSLGDMSKEEVKEQIDFLKFCYYYTSEEGQQILRRGHVKSVTDNVIRENKVLKI